MAVGAVAACGLAGCVGDPVRALDGGGPDSAETSVDGAGDATPGDADADSGSDTVGETGSDGASDGTVPGSDPGCGLHKGGPMVHVPTGGFCIDATEVTAAEYDVFVAATDKGAVPAYCAWNTSYLATVSFGADGPVTNVNWCMAQQYCQWAGKHLCGKLGSAQPGTGSEPESMWAYACVNGSAGNTWTTGDDEPAVVAACTLGKSKPVAPKAATGCHGPKAPFDRILHMNGNVREWDGSGCVGLGYAAPGSVRCGDRGGYFGATGVQAKCVNFVEHPIDFTDVATGFRCCKNLP